MRRQRSHPSMVGARQSPSSPMVNGLQLTLPLPSPQGSPASSGAGVSSSPAPGTNNHLPSSPSISSLLAPGRGFSDVETLTKDLRKCKEALVAAQTENAAMRTQIQRLVSTIKRKDKQITQLIDMKMSAAQDALNNAALSSMDPAQQSSNTHHGNVSEVAVFLGQMRDLRSELVSIARLSDKCRDLESALGKKEDEMHRMKANMKMSLLTELELEAATYYKECRRMQKALAYMHGVYQAQRKEVQQLQARLKKQKSAAGRPSSWKELLHSPTASQTESDFSSSSTAPDPILSASSTSESDLVQSLRQEVESLRHENAQLRFVGLIDLRAADGEELRGGGGGGGTASGRKRASVGGMVSSPKSSRMSARSNGPASARSGSPTARSRSRPSSAKPTSARSGSTSQQQQQQQQQQ